MAQWGSNDQANNSVLWGVSGYKVAPNTANRDAFFGNTTANAFIAGVTVGQYGIGNVEVANNPGITHTGWVVRTVGTGGRAGRVQTEVLVAGGISGDSDALPPIAVITIGTQPANATANSTNNDIATFTVAATATQGAVLTYRWQFANGLNVTANSTYSGVTTTTLSVNSNGAVVDGTAFRVLVRGTNGAANVISANATLTITT